MLLRWVRDGLAMDRSEATFKKYSSQGVDWAADRVAEILVSAGVEHVQVNAAGDLTLRGGFLTQEGVIEPWKIGVVNPDNRQEVLRIFEIHDGAIATSGAYERGAYC